MINFKMVKYGRWVYPENIPIRIEEIAGHFDKDNIYPHMNYSLHTEYSFGSRNFSSKCLDTLTEIKINNLNNIPQLWKSEQWAKEFAQFIFNICKGKSAPEVIEIHPPFKDYTENVCSFVSVYKVFEDIIAEKYPDTKIMIENRCGSKYPDSSFVLSKAGDFVELCEFIEKENLNLRVAFDIPQLFTAEVIGTGSLNRMSNCLNYMKMIREYFGSVHLWGKAASQYNRRSAHHGNLNTYFYNNAELKNEFLHLIADLFDDSRTRYMVLEVNSSNEDMISIINDLAGIDFNFI